MKIVPWKPNVIGQILPSVRFSENKDAYKVQAQFPGMEKKDIKVVLRDNILTIHGEKKQEVEEKKEDSYYKESKYAAFSRSVSLSNKIDKASMKSTFENGVFTLILPKK